METKPKRKRRILLGIVAGFLSVVLAALVVINFYLPRYWLRAEKFDVTNVRTVPGQMSVMSYNVRCWTFLDLGKKSWPYRANLVVENIVAAAPGIIGLQEVTPGQYRYFNKVLVGYDSVIEYRDNSVFREACPIYYNAALYNLVDKGSFWLSETPEVMSKDWRAAHYRICSYVILQDVGTDTKFVVFNTHLDHVSDEARVKGIGVVLDKIAEFGGLPAILMGDLNAEDTSPTYAMATENFIDAQVTASDSMDSATYQNWGAELDSPRIDYIMLSPQGFDVVRYFVMDTTHDGVYPSDHFPICAHLELAV